MLPAALLRPAAECPVPRDLLSDDPAGAGGKPLWPPADAVDVAWELARGGAATVQGEVLDASSGAPRPLEVEPWMAGGDAGPAEVHHRWRRWSCPRRPGEGWEAYADRAAGRAAALVRRLTGVRGGRGGLVVDLAWVTPDEPTLFDLPAALRSRREGVLEEGGAIDELWGPGSSRVSRAGPLPGSFHGAFAAASVAAVPEDARFVRLSRGTRELAKLGARGSLDVVVLDAAQDRHLEAVARVEGVRQLHVSGTVTSLAPVSRLAGLRLLGFGSERRLRDPAPLEPLARLDALRYLELRPSGLRDLGSLPPLAGLASFHLRAFAGRLESLAPLAALAGLRVLTVHGPAVRDPSLAPLGALRRLRHLGLWTGAFPLAEYARLAGALPEAEGTLRSPFQRPEPRPYQVPRCACGGEMVQTLGRPRRTLCAACEPGRAMAYQAEWEALRSAGSGPGGSPAA